MEFLFRFLVMFFAISMKSCKFTSIIYGKFKYGEMCWNWTNVWQLLVHKHCYILQKEKYTLRWHLIIVLSALRSLPWYPPCCLHICTYLYHILLVGLCALFYTFLHSIFIGLHHSIYNILSAVTFLYMSPVDHKYLKLKWLIQVLILSIYYNA